MIGYLRGRDTSPVTLLTNSYSYGTVAGSGSKQGNLLGDADASRVDKCYSCGNGKALIGYNYARPVITNCYWDKDTGTSSSSCGGSPKTTVQMMQEATFAGWDFVEIWDIVENETYPFLRPLIKTITIALDIKPGSCPNPLNGASNGILPAAILGTEEFDVSEIDVTSIRLAGIAAIRHNYEDVSGLVSDSNECACIAEGPDGFDDLTLKFKTQDIVEVLVNSYDTLEKGQTLSLTLTGELFDGTTIEGADCIKLVGNVPKWLAAKKWDGNEDGIINFIDLTELAAHWLESDTD